MTALLPWTQNMHISCNKKCMAVMYDRAADADAEHAHLMQTKSVSFFNDDAGEPKKRL